MKDTLEMIDGMYRDGVITKCAIGGAVGATLYLEPSATLDVDVFVLIPGGVIGGLVNLSPIYQYLTSRGCKVDGEHIVIGTWPVQFMTPGNELVNEALSQALGVDVEGVPTWVMTAECENSAVRRTERV